MVLNPSLSEEKGKLNIMKITIHDPIYSQIEKSGIPLFRPLLSYISEYWKQGPYRRERKTYEKSFMGKDGVFLTGFIPKIMGETEKHKIPLEWKGAIEYIEPTRETPRLKGVTFRPDQLSLISTALDKQRGVLQAPPGIGKTILALGIMSCFEESDILFLCHEKTLINQTYDEMVAKGFDRKEISIIGGGSSEKNFNRITIAMMQTFKKYAEKTSNFFDIVFVDECHRAMAPDSTYYKILTSLCAPVRFGLTATLPNEQSHRLALEGLIGPVIDQLSIHEGVDLGLLAKPKIKIIKVPYSHAIRELRRYPDVYTAGVVNNKARNSLLVVETLKLIQDGKTALILVTKIEHGQNLKNIFNDRGHDIPFIWGQTEGDERNQMKNALQRKNLKCIIASTVFSHGINIPSLGAVINAAGEKSEVATLQRIGRGLRKTDEKDEVIIVDFLDLSHPYLVSHVAHRLELYSNEGWL